MITHEAQLKGAKVLRDRADQRAVYVLELTGYLSNEEIADALGIHLSSVRTVLHRARKRLAADLTAVPDPGEYHVDPDAREAYEPAGGCPDCRHEEMIGKYGTTTVTYPCSAHR